MTLYQLFLHLRPYIRPYRILVVITLLLTFVGSLTAQVNAWVLRYTVDSVNEMFLAHKSLKEGLSVLAIIAIILISKEIINLLLRFGQTLCGERLRIYISKDLAQTVIERILTYKLAFYNINYNQPGKLQTRIDKGVEGLTRLVQNFFIDILPIFATAIVALLMMFQANFYVGLVAFCIMPIYYVVSRAQAKKLTSGRRAIKTLRENKSQGIIGILESIPVIKSFLRENIEEKKQLHLQMDLTETQMKLRKTSFIYEGIKTFIEQMGVVAIILLTTYFVLIGQMSIGAIMFHIMLFNNVSAPIRRLHLIYDQMNDALIYSEGFFEILHADEHIEKSGTYKTDHLKGEFVLKEVNFTYPGNQTHTLYDINMKIEPNKITALVGLSGAGKSTLINLLDKFYEPDSGALHLDGVSLSEYDTSFVRSNIGLVLQKNHIFNGTVKENILYGNPKASDEEVIEAAKKSYIHEQIMTMPDQYETSALSLSGGQQQKIAIARMFLKNPPIIFLDEPTASLDAISTEQIKNSLDAIKQGRTVIIISHSISQIIDADCIYVMENGHMVESGTHEELYRIEDGVYKKIFESMARSLNVEKIARSLEGETN